MATAEPRAPLGRPGLIPFGSSLRNDVDRVAALDVLTTPASVIAGSVASASMISDLSPFLTWSLAIVAGGGIAGVVQVGTVKLRAVSGVTTAGLGNPVVAAGELAGAVFPKYLPPLRGCG